MTARNLLITLGLAGAGYYLYRQYQLYQGLQFGILGIGFAGSVSRPQINLRIALKNPTDVKATLQGLTGQIYAGGNYIAHVTYDSIQVINPYNVSAINLKIMPDLAASIQALADYIGRRTVTFNFTGQAVVDNIPVPVRMDYTLGKNLQPA